MTATAIYLEPPFSVGLGCFGRSTRFRFRAVLRTLCIRLCDGNKKHAPQTGQSNGNDYPVSHLDAPGQSGSKNRYVIPNSQTFEAPEYQKNLRPGLRCREVPA